MFLKPRALVTTLWNKDTNSITTLISSFFSFSFRLIIIGFLGNIVSIKAGV